MAKAKNSVWGIFFDGIKMYFQNFDQFMKYLAFPVLGQVLGIIITLVASYIYAINLPKWVVEGGVLDNFSMIFLIQIVIILPGLLIFAKAFWDFLVAYGAINSMTENMLKSGRVYDFAAHTELITRKTAKYVGLWILFGFFVMIGSFPLFWVLAGILFVYFVLVFQVFTFEPDKSPIGCFKKSMQIIKGNFLKTLGLMLLLGIFTYWAIPEGIKFLLAFGKLLDLMALPIEPWASQLPIDGVNEMLKMSPMGYAITPLMIAKWVVTGSIEYIIICFTLPIRSICWTMWYKSLNVAEAKIDKKFLDRAEGKTKPREK